MALQSAGSKDDEGGAAVVAAVVHFVVAAADAVSDSDCWPDQVEVPSRMEQIRGEWVEV